MKHRNPYPLYVRLSYIGLQVVGEPPFEKIDGWDFHYFDLETNLAEAKQAGFDIRSWICIHGRFLIHGKMKCLGFEQGAVESAPMFEVLSPLELATRNRQYRNRIVYGANRRADIITAIESGWGNPSAIAYAVGCSYEPAHRIVKDYFLLEKVNEKNKKTLRWDQSNPHAQG